MTYPHQSALESLFARSLDGITFEVDAAACGARDTSAFTLGRHVTFAVADPSVRVAAHEAAHAFGVRGEALADFIAAEVAAGRSVAALLPEVAPVDDRARPYTLVKQAEQNKDNYELGEDLRVSDDGHMAVGRGSRHLFYATESMIDQSNATLKSQKSRIELLKTGNTVKGKSPLDGSDRELTGIYMAHADQTADSHNNEGAKQFADCGRSARSVMGEGDPAPRGIHYDGANETRTDQSYAPKNYAREMRRDAGLEPSDAAAEDIYDNKLTGKWRKEFYKTAASEKWYTFDKATRKTILGLDASEELPGGDAKGGYWDLSADQRKAFLTHIYKDSWSGMDAWDKARFKVWVASIRYDQKSDADTQQFDKEQGINQYAAPGVGEAFTIIREDDLGGGGYNFHWAGVVMVSGHDRTTLENFSVDDYNAMNDKWFFEMYGPPTKEGQTFHEQYMDQQSVGTHGTTMAASIGPDHTGPKKNREDALMTMTTNTPKVWLVSDPKRYKDTVITKLPEGTAVVVVDEGTGNWFQVRTPDGKVGWVMKNLVS